MFVTTQMLPASWKRVFFGCKKNNNKDFERKGYLVIKYSKHFNWIKISERSVKIIILKMSVSY